MRLRPSSIIHRSGRGNILYPRSGGGDGPPDPPDPPDAFRYWGVMFPSPSGAYNYLRGMRWIRDVTGSLGQDATNIASDKTVENIGNLLTATTPAPYWRQNQNIVRIYSDFGGPDMMDAISIRGYSSQNPITARLFWGNDLANLTYGDSVTLNLKNNVWTLITFPSGPPFDL